MYIIYQYMPINMFQIEVLYIHYTKQHLVSTVLQKTNGPISSAFKYLVALWHPITMKAARTLSAFLHDTLDQYLQIYDKRISSNLM